MFKFRALTTEDNEILVGELIRDCDTYYIKPTNVSYVYFDAYLGIHQIKPETLSVTYSGLVDKNGTEIYASFEIDGEMTKGGDVVKFFDTTTGATFLGYMQFYSASFCINTDYCKHYRIQDYNIEIIGKQWEANND